MNCIKCSIGFYFTTFCIWVSKCSFETIIFCASVDIRLDINNLNPSVSLPVIFLYVSRYSVLYKNKFNLLNFNPLKGFMFVQLPHSNMSFRKIKYDK